MKIRQRIHWFEGAAGRRTDFVRLCTERNGFLSSLLSKVPLPQLPMHIPGFIFSTERRDYTATSPT